MEYKVLSNSISINGNTYRKGRALGDGRFTEGQVAELIASKSIEAIVEPIVEPTPIPTKKEEKGKVTTPQG